MTRLSRVCRTPRCLNQCPPEGHFGGVSLFQGSAPLRRRLLGPVLGMLMFILVWNGSLGVSAVEGPTRLAAPMLSQWVQSNTIQIHLVRGRVHWSANRAMGGFSRRASVGGRQEQMSVQFTGRSFSISYELQSPEQKYSFQLANRSLQVQWFCKEPDSPSRLEFLQDPGQAVVVKMGEPPSEAVWQATSLWHLAFEEPEVVQKHVIGLLKPFLPEVELLARAKDIEHQMLHQARNMVGLDRARLQALVVQLGDEQYTRREAADRTLRELGPAMVPFLRSLDHRLLDAEQRFRIRRILQTFEAPTQGDSLLGVTEWLMNDPEIWWILLDRPESETRGIAVERLSILLGEPIEFDPKAAPEVRRVQRERLQSKIRPLQSGPASKSQPGPT